jgi:hypothetical protein
MKISEDFIWSLLKNTFLNFWQLWLVIIVVGIAIIIYTYFFDRKPTPLGYQYRPKNAVMSPTEQKMFDMLLEILDPKYYVFAQMHFDTILDYKSLNGEKWFGAFRHINEKSVDFVICNKETMAPIVAIELDDPSHDREDRVRRDIIVNEIFETAQLPLRRFNLKEAADRNYVHSKVSAVLNPTPTIPQ